MRKFVLNIVKFYQIFISPVLGKNCRFFPSCSNYICLTVEKYGIKKGLWLGIKRILRCNQWFQGGVDLP